MQVMSMINFSSDSVSATSLIKLFFVVLLSHLRNNAVCFETRGGFLLSRNFYGRN